MALRAPSFLVYITTAHPFNQSKHNFTTSPSLKHSQKLKHGLATNPSPTNQTEKTASNDIPSHNVHHSSTYPRTTFTVFHDTHMLNITSLSHVVLQILPNKHSTPPRLCLPVLPARSSCMRHCGSILDVQAAPLSWADFRVSLVRSCPRRVHSHDAHSQNDYTANQPSLTRSRRTGSGRFCNCGRLCRSVGRSGYRGCRGCRGDCHNDHRSGRGGCRGDGSNCALCDRRGTSRSPTGKDGAALMCQSVTSAAMNSDLMLR